MLNVGWTLLVSNNRPSRSAVTVRINKPLVIGLIVLALVGLGGLGRVAVVTFKYGFARVRLVQLRQEHRNLTDRVEFLERLAREEATRLKGLALFEDASRLKLGLNAINAGVREAGVGGQPTADDVLVSFLSGPSVRNADSIKLRAASLLRRAKLQNATFSELEEHARRQIGRWAQVPSIWPARGRITSRFGQRMHPFTGYSTRHEGLDIANLEWTPVYATADGVIHAVARRPYYGLTVDIDHHGNGFSTRYAHLVQPAVEEGQIVRRGDLVGYMGNTGRSTGTHLHYEVRKMNRPVDPMDYILPTDVVVD